MENIFDFVRNAVDSNVPTLKEIFAGYNWERVDIKDIFSLNYKSTDTLIIDARSEKEFGESTIPNAVNFPVLSNYERHNVGQIYKNYSQSAAVWLAMQYADPKIHTLKNFLSDNNARGKIIILYCWRGGGRSSYLAKMISDLGYKPVIISGGFKSYRRLVNSFFSRSILPFELLEIAGLTGTGKSELLRAANDFTNVIDLENAAKHYSSLFGAIPYLIRNYDPVHSQSAFENNVFSHIVKGISNYGTFHRRYLIESESRNFGNFILPDLIYNDLQECPCLTLTSGLDTRVKRIEKDYFGSDNEGIELVLKTFTKFENYFRAKISNSVYNNCLTALNRGDSYYFCETLIKKYYDLRYKQKKKTPLLVIEHENLRDTVNVLKDFLNKYQNDYHRTRL